MQADAASGTASAARYDRTPWPSSGKDAASHCTRCTGEPSRANEEAFNAAVRAVTAASRELLDSLTSSAPPKNRDAEAAKARARAAQRYAA